MIFHKQLITVIALLFFVMMASAQDTNYVYTDTSIVSAPKEDMIVDVDTSVASSEDEEVDEDVAFVADTTLKNNRLLINADSAATLKNHPDLAYAKNLDSLLSAYQKQQSEAIRESEDPSWLVAVLGSPITRYFFWMLAIVFVVFIISKLFLTDNIFQRSSIMKSVKILEEDSGTLSPNANYQKLIAQAVSQQNYRLGIRYLYLQSLQQLTQKGVIDFAPDKTNYEYVQELSGKSYKKDFATLTRDYEYAWYGEFVINQNIFETIQDKFKNFNTVL